MKTLILCEKPSVALDFVKALSPSIQNLNRKTGYFEIGNYYITFCFGHLVHALPSNFNNTNNPQNWSLEELPIIPDKFYLYPINAKAKSQLKIIQSLLSKVQKIIIATDAGREGELIARNVLHFLNWKNWENTFRFWTSEALTKDVILKELKNLKPAKDFDSLYFCAKARQEADFIVGINWTRAFTLKTNTKTIWSIGRVQTPTLFLIWQRYKEHITFQPEPYAIIKAFFNQNAFTGYLIINQKLTSEFKLFTPKKTNYDEENDDDDDNKQTLKNLKKTKQIAKFYRNDAEILVKKLASQKFGIVKHFTKHLKKEKPPLLHSLTTLQQEANKLYKFSADLTAKLAQDLYMAKLISYPRSDAQYLAKSSLPLVQEILKRLNRHDLIPKVSLNHFIFNDKNLTDHFAIIPLYPYQPTSKLTNKHEKIYNLILRKFLGLWYSDFIYEEVQVLIDIQNYLFKAQGIIIKEPGWKVLYEPNLKNTWKTELKVGDKVNVDKIVQENETTQPPKLYTEGNILKIMEKLGLGTPATRAEILQTLKKRNYVTLKKGKLVPTSKAEMLINALSKCAPDLLSPELTASWEQRLETIYKQKQGFAGYLNFINDIKNSIRIQIQNLKSNKNFRIDPKKNYSSSIKQ